MSLSSLKRVRWFSTTHLRHDLFGGGGKILDRSKYQQFEAPSGKSEAPSNPADLFKKNDILMFSNKPINYIESVKADGYHLSNGLYIKSPSLQGDIVGTLLLETETYEINLGKPHYVTTPNTSVPSNSSTSHSVLGGYTIINGFILEFSQDVLDIFDKVNPKPEILVIGTGSQSKMLSDKNRKFLLGLGIQLETSISSHAAHVFDLLATERPNVVAGLLLPPNA